MHAFCISFHVLRNSGLFSRGWKKDSLKEQMDKAARLQALRPAKFNLARNNTINLWNVKRMSSTWSFFKMFSE